MAKVAQRSSSAPKISIRLVSSRTGLTPETLRMWERRYGYPAPERRPGGSRLYGEEDVSRLRLIVRAIEAGFRPNEVVSLAVSDVERLLEVANEGPLAPIASADAADMDGILAALRAEDLPRLRGLLRAAALKLGSKAFVTALARPLAHRVGELWAEGVIEVRHEHLLSACLTTQLRVLLAAEEHAERSPTVVLATLPGEPHVLPLDMVGVYLAASLAAPRILGADTPPQQLAAAATALRANAVGVSITVGGANDPQRHLRALARALPDGIALWVGGVRADEVAKGIPRVTPVATWSALDAAIAATRRRPR